MASDCTGVSHPKARAPVPSGGGIFEFLRAGSPLTRSGKRLRRLRQAGMSAEQVKVVAGAEAPWSSLPDCSGL